MFPDLKQRTSLGLLCYPRPFFADGCTNLIQISTPPPGRSIKLGWPPPETGWLSLPGTGLSRATVPAQGLATRIEAQSVQNTEHVKLFTFPFFFSPP